MEKIAKNTTTVSYSPMKMDNLRLSLSREPVRYFDVAIDGIRVVEKTNDLKAFDSYEEFMGEDTREIVVRVFTRSYKSPYVSHNHVFKLSADNYSSQEPNQIIQTQALSGAEIDARIQARVAQERERWDNDQLRREFQENQTKLKEAEDYIELLQNELATYKGKKLHLGNVNLGELASVMVEGMIRRNPQMLMKLPGGESLAGIIEADNKDRQLSSGKTQEPQAGASFRKKESSENNTLSEEDQRYVKVIREMEEHFEEEELQQVMQIIQSLATDTANIVPVAELLGIEQ